MIKHDLGSGVNVHTYACGEGGIFVNAYLVETPVGVVAIDATLTETDSKCLRTAMDELAKPLLAVLITHPHPDHVAGITNLVAGLTPKIIATSPVAELMRRLEAPKRKQWTPVFGSEWVQRWTYPNTIVQSGSCFDFGGVVFRVLDVGHGGDSEQNSVWFIDSPVRTAFVSDMVFNGPHSYVADGGLLAWLANLARIESLCEGFDVVFPGHGPAGAPTQLIARQRDYLLTLAAYVKAATDNHFPLTDAAKNEVEERMKARYPEAGLSFLIPMNLDPIAREIVGKV